MTVLTKAQVVAQCAAKLRELRQLELIKVYMICFPDNLIQIRQDKYSVKEKSTKESGYKP